VPELFFDNGAKAKVGFSVANPALPYNKSISHLKSVLFVLLLYV